MFDDIRPYNDAETAAALKRASNNRLMEQISAFLFPGKDPDILRNTLNTIVGVDDFQTRVMYPAVRSILGKTTKGLTFEGLEWFDKGRCYTMLSSHRDIVLDSAFIQYLFKDNGFPLSEIAVGDNLIYNQFVEDLMRSNRMIKVTRSTNPRELYETSCTLSKYIRQRVHDQNPASVWISHRNGRTKDGNDTTEQGLLKMLSMSGSKDFAENMSELNLMPVSVSYEIESCGIKKAYEVYIKQRMGAYVKRPGEDLESIIMGIVQQKGRVHIAFCKPITQAELKSCAALDKNDRFRELARIIDERILNSWRIWPSNIAAAELLSGKEPSDPYVTSQFEKYLKEELNTLPKRMVDRRAIREILIRIYATPALRKGL
ncbi:MAG: acyltransferase [Bacteroidales bacterium]|nr:acyltransferase [Bacteroidales bacterium]MBR0500420.1 acyltransferase [Bacteroidales bacterium]